jgi:peroxiredoxin
MLQQAKRKLMAGLCGLSLTLMATVASAAANIGQPAPGFNASGADGRPVSLESFRGKTVILEWTNHDCPFVKKHYESGNIPNLQKEATAKGIVWLQVISSAPGKQGYVDGATAQKLNASRGATPSGTVLDPDGKIGKLYGAVTTPHLYIIDPQGVLLYKGGIDSIQSSNKADIAKADNYIKLALSDLGAGRAIAQNNTRPYGCTVKYAD